MGPRVPRDKKIGFEDVVKRVENSSLTTEVKNIFSVMIDCMKSLVSERDSKVADLLTKLEEEKLENQTKLSALDSQLTHFKSENESLRAQITKMDIAHDELEAYGRRESLIFSGDQIKPYEVNENCVDIAKNLINSTLKIPVVPIISTAHRMGRPPAPDSSRPDKRPIIVKFVKRDDKFLIMKTAMNKNTRVPGLFVNESLTPTRSKILYVLRKAKNIEDSPIKMTSTLNGRVFAHHKPSLTAPDNADNLKTEINTMAQLKDFCDNFLKNPLESFLEAQRNNSNI